MRGKDITIGPAVHGRLVKEAKYLGMTHKEYSEAAILFFASRKLDPCTFKEGDTARIVKHIDKGIDRVLSYIVTQEQQVLQNLFSELVNTRIVCEILLSNLHKLSDLSAEEAEKLNAYNNAYIKSRKESIRQYYEKQTYEKK
jgi:hypothetical protein